MKVKILILFLCNSFLINAQTISFKNSENEPIRDAILEFSIEGEPKKFISDSQGVINLNYYLKSKLKVRISHLSYQPFNDNTYLTDTTFILKKKNFIIDEVFITGQIKPTKESVTIQKVRSISRKEIDLRAAENLKDLLEKEMNMRLNYDNILGSSVSIQGISGQNVKILIDGVPLIGRLNGNIDLSQINLNNVAKVEIIEGPLSVDLGTDALAGTINLITKKEYDQKFSSNYNIFYESVGNYNSNVSLTYNTNKHLFSIDFGRRYFDGWSEDDKFSLLPTSQLADTNRVTSWNPKEQYLGRLQYQIKHKNNNLRIYYDSYYEKIINLGMPRLPYYETAFDDYYYTRRHNLGLDYNVNFNVGKNLRVISSFNNYKRIKNTYFKDLVTLDQILTNNNSDQDTSIFNLIMNKLVFSSFKSNYFNYQIGFDSKIENAQGQKIKENKKALGDHAIFLSSKWKPSAFLALKPAVRFSYNSKFNVPIIPSLNLIFMKKKFKTRFSYAKGFRSPSLKELFFEFVDINHNIIGNDNLNSENSDNYQLNFDYEKILSNYQIELGTKLFYNNINNLITLAQSPNSDVYTYFNLGKYKTRGVSTSLNLSAENFNVAISASNIGRYNNLSEENNIVKFSHSNSYNTSFNYTFKKYYLTTSIYYNHMGRLPVFYKNNSEQIIESEIESYQILDISLRKLFLSGKVSFSFGIKNLFDVQDITSFSVSGTHSSSSNSQSIAYGRTFFSALKFTL